MKHKQHPSHSEIKIGGIIRQGTNWLRPSSAKGFDLALGKPINH